MIGIIITLLYLRIVTLEIKVTNVNSQVFQECLEFISSNCILSCSYLLIRLCPDNFCQHPDSELKVTSKLAVYTKLIPNLGNYPAILSLDDCTKTFFVSTNCQLGPWDLRRSLPPDLRHLKVSWFYWFSRDATWQSCGSLAMVSRGQAPSDKPNGKWPFKGDRSVIKTCVCNVYV